MKAINYRQVLKARGYKVEESCKYQGLSVFEKEHHFNRIVCYIEKDSHGKAQTMTFNFYCTPRFPTNITEFKEQEHDRNYLFKEAVRIHEAFEELKAKKSPKYVYCF